MNKYIISTIINLTLVTAIYSQSTIVIKSGNLTIVTITNSKNVIAKIPASYPEVMESKAKLPPVIESVDNPPFNWQLKFSAGNKVFKDISFANTQVGYIVTELGGVYKTTNGGDNWVSVMNLGFPYYWYGVDAISADTVIISGFNNQGPINTGVVRWTFNGGTTWTPDIVLQKPGSGVGWLDRVHFFNQNTGIVMNGFSGGCFRTTTGGKDTSSWSYVTINTDQGWFAGNIDAHQSGRVYATGIHFASSTNYGFPWVSGPPADNVFDGGVDFLDDNILFGWTGGGQISSPVSGWTHRTTDGGISWGARQFAFPYPVRALKFFNQNTGIVAMGNLYNESGGIYSTSDGGANWNLDISTLAEMFSIEYKAVSPDSMDVWCVGSTGGGTGYTGKLYKARMQNLVGVIHVSSIIPEDFRLYQNYPNPFNPATKIKFDIPANTDGGTSNVNLRIFNSLGQGISTLVNEDLLPGMYEVSFDAAKYSSGVYFYSLESGRSREVRKMIILK